MAACRLSMDTEHLRFFFGHMAMATTAMVLLFSIFRYRNFNVFDWQMWAFLFYGLITDTIARLSFSFPPRAYFVINVFNLFESLFFLLFARQFVQSEKLKKLLVILAALSLLAWTWFQFNPIDGVTIHLKMHPTFGSIYCILSTFLYAYLLLRLIESRSNVLRQSTFWYVLGIFFSSFTAYLMQALISDEVHNRIWFLNGIFNSLTSFLFLIGFLQVGRGSQQVVGQNLVSKKGAN